MVRRYTKLIILIIVLCLLLKMIFNYHGRLSSDFNPKKIVYINLDERKDRKENIKRQIKDTGLPKPTRVSAFNGKELVPDDYYPDTLNQDGLKDLLSEDKKAGLTLTKGGLGCMLSHQKIWKEIAELNNGEYYLILEDDAKIDINLKSHMNKAMKEAPPDWDIIYLGTNQQHDPVKVNEYFSKVKRIYCLHGYLINKKGAQKALDYCFPARYQIDTELWLNYESNKMNAYVLNTLLIRQIDELGSNIQINK